jgi:phenylacetate-CoA ligase
MCLIRGANVYPSAIEDALRAIEGFGGEFQMIISRERAMDELVLRVEYSRDLAGQTGIAPGAAEALTERITTRVRSAIGVRPVVRLEPPGTLPRTEFKARRVVDNRRLYEESLRTCQPSHER